MKGWLSSGSHLTLADPSSLRQTPAEWSGEERLGVLLEGHGRDALDSVAADVTRTVGWFTSMCPVVLQWEAGFVSVLPSMVTSSVE